METSLEVGIGIYPVIRQQIQNLIREIENLKKLKGSFLSHP